MILTSFIWNECTLSLVVICHSNITEVPTGGRTRWKGVRNWTQQTQSLLCVHYILLLLLLVCNGICLVSESCSECRDVLSLLRISTYKIYLICVFTEPLFVFPYAVFDNLLVMSTDLIKMSFTTRWVYMLVHIVLFFYFLLQFLSDKYVTSKIGIEDWVPQTHFDFWALLHVCVFCNSTGVLVLEICYLQSYLLWCTQCNGCFYTSTIFPVPGKSLIFFHLVLCLMKFTLAVT